MFSWSRVKMGRSQRSLGSRSNVTWAKVTVGLRWAHINVKFHFSFSYNNRNHRGTPTSNISKFMGEDWRALSKEEQEPYR